LTFGVDGVEKKNTEGLRQSSELMYWIAARLVFAHNSRTLFGFRALAYPEGAKTIAISGYRQVMARVLLAAEMTCRNTAAVSPLHPRSISTFFPFNFEVNPTDLDESKRHILYITVPASQPCSPFERV